MSISGPTFRLDSKRLAEAVPLLVSAATEVSHRLGWGQRTCSSGPVTRLTSAGHARTDLALPLAVNGTSGSQSHVDP